MKDADKDGITKIVLESGNVKATVYEAVINGKINTIIHNQHGITITLFNGDELFISSFTLKKMGLLLTAIIISLIEPFFKSKD